jgi:hypothetical protein
MLALITAFVPLGMFSQTREAWPFYVFFPLGLSSKLPVVGDAPWRFALLGWAIYLLLAYPVLLAKTRRSFLIAYGVFCLVLAINVAGCQQMNR